jgi:hypothetical protein
MATRQHGREQALQSLQWQLLPSQRRQLPPVVECWVTGAYATVLAATSQAGAVDRAFDDDRERDVMALRSPRCRSSSPFSLAETVRRLESAARHHGLAVFARLTSAAPRRLGPATWLVLGVDEEHTPVVRTGPYAAIELPLALHVVPHGDRLSAEIEFSDSAWLADHAELPPDWTRPLAEIPRLVGDALC